METKSLVTEITIVTEKQIRGCLSMKGWGNWEGVTKRHKETLGSDGYRLILILDFSDSYMNIYYLKHIHFILYICAPYQLYLYSLGRKGKKKNYPWIKEYVLTPDLIFRRRLLWQSNCYYLKSLFTTTLVHSCGCQM